MPDQPNPSPSEALERVYYHDAWFDAGQTEREDWLEEYVVSVVGFVVRDTRKVLSVASEVHPDGGFRAVTHIPAKMVKRRVVLSGMVVPGEVNDGRSQHDAHRRSDDAGAQGAAAHRPD